MCGFYLFLSNWVSFWAPLLRIYCSSFIAFLGSSRYLIYLKLPPRKVERLSLSAVSHLFTWIFFSPFSAFNSKYGSTVRIYQVYFLSDEKQPPARWSLTPKIIFTLDSLTSKHDHKCLIVKYISLYSILLILQQFDSILYSTSFCVSYFH